MNTLLLIALLSSPGNAVLKGLDVYGSDGNCAYWAETEIGATKVDPGGSGATLVVRNTASLVWLLDATTEYLYSTTDIHDDWDNVSDVVVSITVALNAAETANDDIEMEVIAEYYGAGDDMDTPKTATRTVNRDIASDNQAGKVFKLSFVFDWELGGNIIEKGDKFKTRFRLDSVASVAGVRFLYANVKVRTCKPAQPTGGSFPVEG